MRRQIQITFPLRIGEPPRGWNNALLALTEMVADEASSGVPHIVWGEGSFTSDVTITFSAPVEFPPGWDHVLVDLVDMICEAYEKKNPSRVMWPGGYGSRPRWVAGDIEGFDDDVYVVEVCEREASEKELARRRADA